MAITNWFSDRYSHGIEPFRQIVQNLDAQTIHFLAFIFSANQMAPVYLDVWIAREFYVPVILMPDWNGYSNFQPDRLIFLGSQRPPSKNEGSSRGRYSFQRNVKRRAKTLPKIAAKNKPGTAALQFTGSHSLHDKNFIYILKTGIISCPVQAWPLEPTALKIKYVRISLFECEAKV